MKNFLRRVFGLSAAKEVDPFAGMTLRQVAWAARAANAGEKGTPAEVGAQLRSLSRMGVPLELNGAYTVLLGGAYDAFRAGRPENLKVLFNHNAESRRAALREAGLHHATAETLKPLVADMQTCWSRGWTLRGDLRHLEKTTPDRKAAHWLPQLRRAAMEAAASADADDMKASGPSLPPMGF